MKIRLGLLILIFISFILRMIQARLDYNPLFGDEWVLCGASFNMMVTGNLKNLFFGYGDVCKIPYLFIDMFAFLVGVWRGIYDQVANLVNLESFVYANRLWNVVLGALSIGVAFRLGVKLLSRQLGWILALLVFANPLIFKYSLYSNPDDTAFFFMLLSMVFALDILSEDSKTARKGYFLSALFIALSIGAKVNHITAVVFPLLLHFYARKDSLLNKCFNLNLAYFILIIPVVYLLVSPTVLLGLPVYLDFWLRFFFNKDMGLEANNPLALTSIMKLFGEYGKIMGGSLFVVFALVGAFQSLKQKVYQIIFFITVVLTFSFLSILQSRASYGIDPHAMFPLVPHLLILTGLGIYSVAHVFEEKILKQSKNVPVIVCSVLICLPLFQYILNFEKNYTYLGGANKESFFEYLIKGKTDIQSTPLKQLDNLEKKVLASPNGWMNSKGELSQNLTGTTSRLIQAIPETKNSRLKLQISLDKSAELFPALIQLRVSGVERSLGFNRKLWQKQTSLWHQGNWNWRHLGMGLDKIKAENNLIHLNIPLKGGETYLVELSLKDPFDVVSAQIKNE